MLAAYFDIKGPSDSTPTAKQTSKPTSKPKTHRTTTKKAKPPKVEPFESGTMHARFEPPVAGPEPQAAVSESFAAACQTLDNADVDPYEYLFQEADAVVTEDDDTDSCLTFDDDGPDVDSSPRLGSSPVVAEPPVFLRQRRTKASEVPVYTGPELWFEDDDFIE